MCVVGRVVGVVVWVSDFEIDLWENWVILCKKLCIILLIVVGLLDYERYVYLFWEYGFFGCFVYLRVFDLF